mmetsp:Transcript_21132/g.34358  ORF Transcript_21132/g.34358 Transcript_21132/m.34358 type:complete len:161 (-) Transcript_21132:261-743(-)
MVASVFFNTRGGNSILCDTDNEPPHFSLTLKSHSSSIIDFVFSRSETSFRIYVHLDTLFNSESLSESDGFPPVRLFVTKYFHILKVFAEWKNLQTLINTNPNKISNGINSSPPTIPTILCCITAAPNAMMILKLHVLTNVDKASNPAALGPPSFFPSYGS